MFRRICFYAGAGSGKSTLAAKTYAQLKIAGYDVEHIPEYIKSWAYTGKQPISYDQLYVFAKQLHAEDVFLQKVDHLVTDSPLLLNTAYSQRYGFHCAGHLIEMARQFDRDYPPINLFIERSVDYVTKGRYGSLEDSLEFDAYLRKFLDQHLEGELTTVRVEDFDTMLALITDKLDACSVDCTC